eukprot:1309821-Pyramimonas_sp.AAC.1
MLTRRPDRSVSIVEFPNHLRSSETHIFAANIAAAIVLNLRASASPHRKPFFNAPPPFFRNPHLHVLGRVLHVEPRLAGR